MKLSIQIGWFSVIALLFSACTNTPDSPKLAVDPTLPKVEEIKTISDINSIAFEWQVVDDSRVAGYVLYRDDNRDGKIKKLSREVDSRYSNHYVDEGLEAGHEYVYYLATRDTNGRISSKSAPVKTKTLPFQSVPFVQAISNYPQQVKVIWRPHDNPKVNGYIVERSDISSPDWGEVGKTDSRLFVEFIDQNLKNNYTYRYRIRATTFDGVTSLPSEVSTARTKALPGIIGSSSASTDLPRRIEVRWQNPSQKEVAHYNVYRASYESGPYRLQTKLNRTKYIDAIDEDGAFYYYKITATDSDGLESPMPESPIAGRTLPKPAPPFLTSATIESGQVVLKWEQGDNRAEHYIVTKKSGRFLNAKVTKFKIRRGMEFKDDKVAAGETYRYSIAAVDSYGIISPDTEEIELFLPEAPKTN